MKEREVVVNGIEETTLRTRPPLVEVGLVVMERVANHLRDRDSKRIIRCRVKSHI